MIRTFLCHSEGGTTDKSTNKAITIIDSSLSLWMTVTSWKRFLCHSEGSMTDESANIAITIIDSSLSLWMTVAYLIKTTLSIFNLH